MGQNISFSSLTLGENAAVAVFFALALVTLVALLTFVAVSIQEIVSRQSPYWRICFLLCSCALGGWMVFYTALLYITGDVMFFPGNLIFFLCLVLSAFVSTIFRFNGLQRYVVIAVIALSLASFNMVFPVFNAFRLLRPK